MGKAKKRGFNRQEKKLYTNISRDEAIKETIALYETNQNADYLVSLFGLTLEELLEAGGDYELLVKNFHSQFS